MATRKPKRKLTDISFEKEGAHVALVSKDQGGAANGHSYSLVLKANNFSQEYIEKMQQVRVTMDLPDFLERFFHLYGSDAQVLARMMGYVPEEKEEEEWSYEKYIEERLEQFEVLKSLNSADDLNLELAKLDQETYLGVLKAQELLEPILEKAKEGSTEAVAKAKVSDEETKAKVEPSGEITKQGKSMDEDVKVETVEKSALDAVQKTLDDTLSELTKAREQLAVIEAEKKAAIVKSKTGKITEIVKDEKQAAVIVKAALALESDEDFSSFVTVVKDLVTKFEQSELFKETGASGSDAQDKVVESPVAKAVKAQLAKATKSK